MRISDWSSDVCSSDLTRLDGAAPVSAHIAPAKARTAALSRRASKGYDDMINQGRHSFLSVPMVDGMLEGGVPILIEGQVIGAEIGRASCRGRVCQYV